MLTVTENDYSWIHNSSCSVSSVKARRMSLAAFIYLRSITQAEEGDQVNEELSKFLPKGLHL